MDFVYGVAYSGCFRSAADLLATSRHYPGELSGSASPPNPDFDIRRRILEECKAGPITRGLVYLTSYARGMVYEVG
jgi:hypothetical protein